MQTSACRDSMLRSICFSRTGLSSSDKPAAQVVDHLADRDGLLVHLHDRTRARAVQNLLERFHQIDHVSGQLRLGAFGVFEFLQRRIRPDRVFDLLLLQEHLRGGL